MLLLEGSQLTGSNTQTRQLSIMKSHAFGLSVENVCAGTPLYCIVKCGGKRVRTPVPSPTFGTKVNFYIRNPASAQVTVQVSVSSEMCKKCFVL